MKTAASIRFFGKGKMPMTIAAATGITPSEWYDGKKVDPTLPGWYTIEASNLSKAVYRLFWTGIRWLYAEGGKLEYSPTGARFVRWQGAAPPTGATFKPEKRKKAKRFG